MNQDKMKEFLREYWFDILIYGLIILILWSILTRENIDLTCTDESATVCNTGSSMALSPGEPQEGDSIDDLLEKIVFTSRYEHNSVVWRRAFVSSAIIVFITLYIVLRRFPRALEFLAGLVISFTILYTTILIYQPLTTDKAVTQISSLVEKVKEHKR